MVEVDIVYVLDQGVQRYRHVVPADQTVSGMITSINETRRLGQLATFFRDGHVGLCIPAQAITRIVEVTDGGA